IPRVRKELGYPPLVTPTSQIVGTQAVLNVLSGERYKIIPGEVRSYVQGLYGKPPAPLDSTIKAKILGDRPEYTCRPADLMEPMMEKVKEEARGLVTSSEDLLTYAIFPKVAKKFFEDRKAGRLVPVTITAAGGKPSTKKIKSPITEEELDMNLQEIKELVQLINNSDIGELALENKGMKVAIRKNFFRVIPDSEAGPAKPETTSSPGIYEQQTENKKNLQENAVPGEGIQQVKAPMVGTFYIAPDPGSPPFVKVGDMVARGQTLCIVEAMKLMNEIESTVSGEIVKILLEDGSPVEYGQPMFWIRVSQ
ncbi:MAG: acetyl-CoA carboxylase biotin carboxyl carrier protein, partial [Firmicutes bacterium]|nr:acetyl-CoA carboxylase biotin carboxyl carrier protein [Bacillota bacterium]